ncbi:hypothetical protein SLE2022_214900 [Rubroshorea leprosula]
MLFEEATSSGDWKSKLLFPNWIRKSNLFPVPNPTLLTCHFAKLIWSKSFILPHLDLNTEAEIKEGEDHEREGERDAYLQNLAVVWSERNECGGELGEKRRKTKKGRRAVAAMISEINGNRGANGSLGIAPLNDRHI